MANKLFTVTVTLAFFFFLTNTNASIYRTIDEETSTGSLETKEKLSTNDLIGCQQWLHEQAKIPPNFYLKGSQDKPELLQKCCQELDQESPVSVCPTLEETAKEVKIQGDYGYYQTLRIYQVAQYLPKVCNIPNVGPCPFKIPYLAAYY